MNRLPATRVLVALVLLLLTSGCSSKNGETSKPRPPEELLRAELETWKKTPYLENGTSQKGIGNAGFVRAVLFGALGLTIPGLYDAQLRTGKLVTREALAPGDLVFFEGQGIGPFRPRSVAIFVGHDEVALAHKEFGVAIVHLSETRWSSIYKTARHITDPNAAAPTFDAAKYGSNRAGLLRDIAKAWTGTLYLQGGTTFDGIGNDEFVRAVYEAIYDTELSGTPTQWATMGEAVERKALRPGDIILYEAVGIGSLLNRRHAGLYIGDGDFVHAVKGSAVTISALDDPRWSAAFRAARRINPDVLTRAAEARAAAAPTAAARGAAKPTASRPTVGAPSPAVGNRATNPAPPTASAAMPPRAVSEYEHRLRDAAEHWRGTPYRIGGTTKSGVDCSAFTRAIYEEVYQVELPRTAEEQERLGTTIDRDHLESGDLVFFRTQGMGPLFQSRHVGLYLGGGEFVQASGSKGVTISRLDEYYWNKKYAASRRLPK